MRRILRCRPSPAMVVASLALLVALGGVAFASIPGPGGKIKACYRKSTGGLRVIDSGKSCSKKKERTLTWNQQGPRGLQGVQGLQGKQGIQGIPGSNGNNGTNGSPAASWVSGGLTFNTVTTAGTSQRSAVSGAIPAIGASSGAEDALSPNAQIVVRDLTVRIAVAPGTGATRQFTIVDDLVTTAVKCQIKDLDTTCHSGSETALIEPGSVVQMESKVLSPGSNAASTIPIWGFRAITP
jgi:hypothetical protein